MVLEWREREHEDMDRESLRDAPTLQALQQCGFVEVLLHFQHEGQCPLTRTSDELVRSRPWCL